jgi:hypothetical protein
VKLGATSWFQFFALHPLGFGEPMLVLGAVGILRSQRALPQDAQWLKGVSSWNLVQICGSSSCGEPMLVLGAVGILRSQRALPQDAR